MKRIRFNGELALLIALITLALAIAFIIKADFGITVVQAPVYVLSSTAPIMSMGIWNYIVQGSLFLIMLMVVKRFKLSYIVSFISAIVYGLLLDLFLHLLRDLTADVLYIRIVFFIIGFILTAIAVAIFFTCKAPLMPYDIFIREISEVKNIKIVKFKWAFDIACLVVALSISLIIKGRIVGIGIGTAVFAFLMSPVMGQIIKILNRYIEFVPTIKGAKSN